MLGIQLGTLSAPELRRLLESARARGQDGLARQLEAELTGRTSRAPIAPLPMAHRPPPPSPAEPAARRTGRPTAPRPVRHRRGPALAVASVAGVLGAALAWGVTLQAPQAPQPQPITLAAHSQTPRISVALTTVALPEEAEIQPEEEAAAPAAEAAVDEAPAPPPEPAQTAKADGRNPCYDLPTARERLVCGYPSVAIQDKRMRTALERARAGSRDPGALDDSQAAWQSASANVSDRLVLMERYAKRIAQLEDDAR